MNHQALKKMHKKRAVGFVPYDYDDQNNADNANAGAGGTGTSSAVSSTQGRSKKLI